MKWKRFLATNPRVAFQRLISLELGWCKTNITGLMFSIECFSTKITGEIGTTASSKSRLISKIRISFAHTSCRNTLGFQLRVHHFFEWAVTKKTLRSKRKRKMNPKTKRMKRRNNREKTSFLKEDCCELIIVFTWLRFHYMDW